LKNPFPSRHFLFSFSHSRLCHKQTDRRWHANSESHRTQRYHQL